MEKTYSDGSLNCIEPSRKLYSSMDWDKLIFCGLSECDKYVTFAPLPLLG